VADVTDPPLWTVSRRLSSRPATAVLAAGRATPEEADTVSDDD
jgi:hypothetical protein